VDSAANVAKALKQRQQPVSLFMVAEEVNSVGLALLGGQPLEIAFSRLDQESEVALVVVENDLYRRASRQQVDRVLDRVSHLVVLDHQYHDTAKRADLLLPAATFVEGDGTVVSSEGRAQRYFQVYEPAFYDESVLVKESWRWLDALGQLIAHRHYQWRSLDELTTACAQSTPALLPIVSAAPNARFRIKGMKLAREPHRYSGRTAMRANLDVHERRAPQDEDSPFAFSMEGYSGSVEPFQQVPFAWAPGWNSPSAWNKFQAEVGGHLRAGDPGLRLIEADESSTLHYFNQIPAHFTPHGAGWMVVNFTQLFGSEELTARSEVFQQRMRDAKLHLNRQDAARLGLAGELVEFEWEGSHWRLQLQLSDELPSGLMGLPLGLPGLPTALHHQQIATVREAVL
jgi:NADH-quinone oxidoreductase subunit G